ncbi:MAG: hypothetical protein RIR19_23 [Chloroflexota bacterium]
MLNLRNRLRTSVVAALALTIAVSGIAYATAPSIDAGAKGKIEGSGATFPWNQYKDWFSSFTDETSDKFSVSDANAKLVLNYTGGGSGAGIANFYGANADSDTQMFSGTDAVLSSSERSAIAASRVGSNYTVIPVISGPLAVVYRVDGLKKGGVKASLRLNGEVLCGIYSGQIKLWNDAKIKKLNPGVTGLPAQKIQVVGRSDSSGTTYVFTSYLGKAAVTTQKNCGMQSNFAAGEANFNDAAGTFAPTKTAPGTYFAGIRTANGADPIVGKAGNGGIAPFVKATNLTISYVEWSYAKKYALSTAAIRTNSAVSAYLKPSAAGTVAALAKAAATEDPINPSAAFVQPVYASGTTSYPIVGYSWLMLYTDYLGVQKGQVQGLVSFLNWALTTGQGSTFLYNGYVALPTAVRNTAIAELHKIKHNGTPVWP